MQSSNILCFQEIGIKDFEEVPQFINLSKYKYIHNFDGHGLILLYDKNMMCSSMTIDHLSGSEFIVATFNEGHRKAIHVITLYRSHLTSILSFISCLEKLLCKIPLACPTVILGNFNIDFNKEIDKHKYLQVLHVCMSKYHFKQHLSISKTKLNSLINHIWSNIPSHETFFGVADAYWPDYHKPIYCAFKLLNTMPYYCYNKPKFFN